MYVCTNYVRKYISLNDLLSIFIAIIRKNNSFLNSDSFMGSNPKIFNNFRKNNLFLHLIGLIGWPENLEEKTQNKKIK